MGRRPKRAPLEQSPYIYKNLIECEEAGDHRVTPTTWPPPRTRNMATEDPSLNMQCELCGCWLIVYEGHADGRMEGIQVIVPREKSVV